MAYPTPKKTMGRPAVFQDSIYTEIRRRVLSGELQPGGRIPTRRELCEEFNASTVTIQQAIERLIRDGFLEAQGARGTFVTTDPPHLTRYALVFPQDAKKNRFWQALNQEASHLRHSGGVELVSYFMIDGHSDRKEYQQLVADVTHHRLAGLIFATVPYLVKDTPLITEPGIPRAAIGGGEVSPYGCVRVCGVFRDIIVKSVDILERHNRQHIAVLLPHHSEHIKPLILDELAMRGLSVPSWWIQSVNYNYPDCARNLTHLLAKGTGGRRPDALIICNDNLVETATQGLVDAGIRVPEDMLVVTHCNFPWPPANQTPVIRVGHNAGDFLNEAIASIDAQRKGEAVVSVRYVTGVREEIADVVTIGPET